MNRQTELNNTKTVFYYKDYPYNLLIAARGNKMLEFPPALTKDVLAGITYALSTFEDEEQEILLRIYRDGEIPHKAQKQAESKALKKLRHPSRWEYIRYGVTGCLKKREEETKRKGYIEGYRAGYEDGVQDTQNGASKELGSEAVLDFPVATMALSVRTLNALTRSGCKTIRDVVALSGDEIKCTRSLGKKGVLEVSKVIQSYGIRYTAWELLE